MLQGIMEKNVKNNMCGGVSRNKTGKFVYNIFHSRHSHNFLKTFKAKNGCKMSLGDSPFRNILSVMVKNGGFCTSFPMLGIGIILVVNF